MSLSIRRIFYSSDWAPSLRAGRSAGSVLASSSPSEFNAGFERDWDASAVPSALVDDPILRLEWHRKHLYVLAEHGLYTSSLHSDAWRRLD
jgi:hypothetical protein